MCATSAGGSPRSCAATHGRTCGTPDGHAGGRSSPPTSIRRRSRPSGRELVAGIALAGGAPTGHAAIVARALGHPARARARGGAASGRRTASRVVAVDGTDGPTPRRARAGRRSRRSRSPRAARRPSPAGDRAAAIARRRGHGRGQRRRRPLEAEAAALAGADGIGLVRTELLFLGRTYAPERRRAARHLRADPGRDG